MAAPAFDPWIFFATDSAKSGSKLYPHFAARIASDPDLRALCAASVDDLAQRKIDEGVQTSLKGIWQQIDADMKTDVDQVVGNSAFKYQELISE